MTSPVETEENVPRSGRIFVAGHRGLVGSSLVRALHEKGYSNILTCSREQLDLTKAVEVERYFAVEKPEYLIIAAARVGGIVANESRPVDFLRDNLLIQTNLLDAAHRFGVTKTVFLGSSCIYPRMAPQPITEDALLTGPLEPTNQWYAIAKIAGIRLAQAYHQQYGMRVISLMPTNLYGPGDNFDPLSSHVLPALLRKFHEAKAASLPVVSVWGTGSPRREFLHVDDLADAVLVLLQNYESPEIINVGAGKDISIRELSSLIQQIVGYQGSVEFDTSRPDGTPRKVLDMSRMTALGWSPRVGLREGIAEPYPWFAASPYAAGV